MSPLFACRLSLPQRTLLAAAAVAACTTGLPAVAQTTPTAQAPLTATPGAVTTIVITGNPLGRDATASPVSVLAGDGLTLRRAGTLGETLDGLPGVASTWFGPNASRPVIRGLDGDRIRLLDNGGSTLDASSLSFDHAVAIDPLAVERIEVLRGPAALLYGGNATGGVVNSIDNRIPRAAITGVGGRAEVRVGGAASTRAASALVEGGGDGFAWHADGFARRSDDLRVPTYTPIADGEALPPTDRVRNSAARAQGGAVGGSWIGRDGHLGLSLETLRNEYGVTAEPDVTIRMERERVALAGTQRGIGWVEQLEAQASHTRYQHQEVEGDGAVGTTFGSRGTALRVQARHVALATPLGALQGVVGVQSERQRFSALGEEAFVPGTQTRSNALFVVEELQLGRVQLTAGLRGEQVQVDSDGDAADAAEPKFGAAVQRRFKPASGSLGAAFDAGGGWQLSTSFGHTERAPADYELYANGLHLATAAFEVGDPTLGLERSNNLELGARWKHADASLQLSLFRTRFSRFIALEASGNSVDVEGDLVPEVVFRGVAARLQGLEIDGRWRVAGAPLQLELTGGIDVVRGDNLDSGEPLPRIAPLRVRAGVDVGAGHWRGGLGLRHAAAQDRVPATDTATASHTLADLWFSWQQRLPMGEALLYARIDNIGNTLASNASSIRTLRDLAPLPGRSVSAGLRLAF